MLKRTATSSGGRQADYPVITGWDVQQNRTITELVNEIAQIGGWTTDRALMNLNFGIRNVRQNECARTSETTPKKRRAMVLAEPGKMLGDTEQVEAAIELAAETLDADDAKIELIYDRLFPNGSTDRNGDVLHGAEAAAR